MIKELLKYGDYLKRYRENNALPQGDVKNALVDIYEANWHTHKNWGGSKINRGCPSCISDMMKSLCAEWEKAQKEYKFVEELPTYKLEPDLTKPITINLNNDKGEVIVSMTAEPDPHKMEWGELRKYATSKGINTKGKKKADILRELEEING